MAVWFPVELQSVRFRQSLSLWERWHGVSRDGEGEDADQREQTEGVPRLRGRISLLFVPNSTFWGENRKRLSKVHKKAAQSLAGAGLAVPGKNISRNRMTN